MILHFFQHHIDFCLILNIKLMNQPYHISQLINLVFFYQIIQHLKEIQIYILTGFRFAEFFDFSIHRLFTITICLLLNVHSLVLKGGEIDFFLDQIYCCFKTLHIVPVHVNLLCIFLVKYLPHL
jgi:hypothetical protein